MDGKDAARAAHKLLQAELRSRGRGAITEVEDALGWARRKINRMRQENVLRLADLVDILDRLDILPSAFLRQVEQQLEQGMTWSSGRGGLAALPLRTPWDDELVARLEAADELRYDDPVAALRAVSDLRPKVSRAMAQRYYAIGGSAYRSLDLFEQARACLEIAFAAAASERELAECHRRLAVTYILTDPNAALSEVEKARDLYTASGDEIGRHTAFVDGAACYRAMAQLQAAKDLATRALHSELLPPRYQVAAHQEIALVELESGQRDRGLRRLEMALAAADRVTDRSTRGNLLGLAARIFRSTCYYDLAIDSFGDRFPFEALALGLEKCHSIKDIAAQEETIRTLRAYCRHPSYQRFLDHVYASVRMGRFTNHTFDFSSVRERWRVSQTRSIRILTAGVNGQTVTEIPASF